MPVEAPDAADRRARQVLGAAVVARAGAERAGRELQQLQHVASGRRHRLDLLSGDRTGDARGRGIDQRRRGG